MQQKLSEILSTLKEWKEDVVFLLIVFGILGSSTRLAFEKDKKHSIGRKFLIVLTGGTTSYLVGSIAKNLNFDSSWTSLIGFFCGMFGYSLMRYTIDNEKAMFNTIGVKFADFIDLCIERIASFIPRKESSKNKIDDETEQGS